MRSRLPGLARFWRLTPLIALGTAIALLVAGLLIVYSGEHSYRAQKAKEIEVQALILASTVAAALTFDDRKAALIYVRALAANPEIEAAAVYNEQGALFAAYRRNDSLSIPNAAPDIGLTVDDDRLSAIRSVKQDSSTIGRIYVRAILEPLIRRYERYAVIGLLVIMAALVTAVLGVAQSALARSNSELAAANASLEAEIAEREKAEAALRQAQKMEAIGQLTGGVAHDFNNILQVILGNLGTVEHRLESGIIDPHAARRAIAAAIRAGERAATLTAQLLAFSRRQTLAPQPIDPNRLIGGMSELLHRTLGESIEVETAFDARLWQTMVDSNQLENALLNLAVNARDAMPAGGKLTIETANVFLDEAYALSEAIRAGQYVMIAVTDTGLGMAPETVSKAFDPFFTTKEVGQGTGLGLSQVYGFIRQSGGHAKIYSEPGEGTTVKLYLPRLISDAVIRESDDVKESEVPRGGREIILAVEDEPDVRNYVVEMLRELGYQVIEAADGWSALRILEARSDIKLLFTDVGLPGGINGRHLADHARRLRPSIKVLFSTGYARNAIVHQGRLDSGVELIGKPFTNRALATRIREILKSENPP
jgi:signal transduction histidine kinase